MTENIFLCCFPLSAFRQAFCAISMRVKAGSRPLFRLSPAFRVDSGFFLFFGVNT